MYFFRLISVSLVAALLALLIPASLVQANIQGDAVIEESEPGLSDMLVVNLTNVTKLGANEAYQGWLVTDNGSARLSVGVLAVDDNGVIEHTYSNPEKRNLASIYDKFEITIEPVPDPSANASTKVAYRDQLPAGALPHIRHLLYSLSGNPNYTSGPHNGTPKGITVGLWQQTNVAHQHAALAAAGSTLDEVKLHLAHVINIVEGSSGANFVASAGNPGDGAGVLKYAGLAKTHAQLALTASPGDAIIARFEPNVSQSSDDVASWAGQARDAAIQGRATDSLTIAQAYATNAEILLDRSLNGFDADRDGTIAWSTGEAGATQAHLAAQNMATYNPTVPAPAAPSTGDISYTVFAVIALAAGAFILVSGGYYLRRTRRVHA
jgi:LPXTG-motif cell wall-anchored protein